MTELLKQRNGEPLAFEKQVVSIYAGINGLFTDVAVENVTATERMWLEYIDGQHNALLQTIAESGKLEDSTTEGLDAAMANFKAAHSELFVVAE